MSGFIANFKQKPSINIPGEHYHFVRAYDFWLHNQGVVDWVENLIHCQKHPLVTIDAFNLSQRQASLIEAILINSHWYTGKLLNKHPGDVRLGEGHNRRVVCTHKIEHWTINQAPTYPLITKIEISEEDHDYLLACLKVLDGKKVYRKGWTVNVAPIPDKKPSTLILSDLTVGNNEDNCKVWCNKTKGKCYFNVEGNPISFLTGQNVVGTVQLPLLILEFYKKVNKAIKAINPDFRLPKSVVRKIKDLDIYINQLAFASYGPELSSDVSIKILLDAIDHIYSFALPDLPTSSPCTLKAALGLRVVREGPTSIRFDKFSGKHRYWSLALYDKEQEQKENGRSVPCSLKNRIRFDLTLHNFWFKVNRLPKLSKIHERYGQDYVRWVQGLFKRVLDDVKIGYMLTFQIKPFMKESPAFQQWVDNRNLNKVDKARLQLFGLDPALTFMTHVLAATARATFGLDIVAAKYAALGCQENAKKLGRQFTSGLLNPGLPQLLGHEFSPAYRYVTYLVKDQKLVDATSGEICPY